MKKTLLFVAALCLGTSAFAQLDTIPNASFTSWTDGISQEPSNWGTINGNKFVVGPPIAPFTLTLNVSQASVTRAKGADSLSLGTIQLNTTAATGQAVPGIAVSNVSKANIKFAGTSPTFSGGFPYRMRAESLTGMCKYIPAGPKDSALIAVILTKWNRVTNSRDTVGGGSQILTDTVEWQSFTAPISYSVSAGAALSPDTAMILLVSSATQTRANSKVGTKLFVDDLDLVLGCTLDPSINTSVKAPDQQPPNGDTLRITAGVPYSKTITIFIPDSIAAADFQLDSVVVVDSLITTTGLANGTYTLTSNWGTNGHIGSNTIACITISGILNSPINGKGSLVVDPMLYGSLSGSPVDGMTTSTLGPIPPTVVIIGNGGGVGIQNFSLGGGFNVNQNIPNPFDGSTTINFNAVGNGNIDFTVTDVLGRQVYDTNINATLGGNTFVFTTDLANGTYFFSLSDGKNTVTKKMVVTK
jgi:Secretion system C-terminal sorting domain